MSAAFAAETFAQAGALESELRRTVKGEVRFDAGSRAAYAADASNYRQVPIGLVVPEDEADIVAAVAACRKFRAPILSRGAGTSLAGQGCNAAVVLDFSRNFNRILEINPEKRYARVQPGVIYDVLKNETEKHRLFFPPDPATHNRCTVGGMIGNNSSGAHGLMGGKVQDNVEGMRVLLYDGTIIDVGPTPPAELSSIISAGGRRGEIYAGLLRLRDRYGELARKRFPRIPRRVSGYNFDELLPETPFNVARALVGTEGTCAIILEARLRLAPSPPHRSLVCIGFRDVFVAADAVPEILRFKPTALEGFEGDVLRLMRKKNLQADSIALLPPGDGFLLVEFGGSTPAGADAEADTFVDWLRKRPDSPAVKVVRDKAEAECIWKVRESGNGVTAIIPGRIPMTHEGWEDSAVDPKVLGQYLREFKALVARHGLECWFYGHFGEGVVHQRLTFDFETAEGVRKFRKFLEEGADLVVKFNGSISGEHGDGHARAFLYEKMFGPELVGAFREFKALWDPDGRLNPGKIVDPYPPEAFLKHGPDHHPREIKTHFRFPDDFGSMERAASRCVGVGSCRRLEGGLMCPSYQATREEIHSTRGRAHLLAEMLRGDFLAGGWKSREVKESLDLCLACKGCKSDCPTGVDVAMYKSEFLSHHYDGKLRPLSHYAFGHIDRWARLASVAPRLVNGAMGLPGAAALAKQVLGIAPQRALPRFADESFAKWLRRQPSQSGGRRGEVVLFADTFNNYFHPGTSRAALEVLIDAGFSVYVPQAKGHVCCGRPLYDFGMLDAAKRYLAKALAALAPHLEAGRPVIMLEPSCASVFRDEAGNLFPDDPLVGRLRRQTFGLAEFLQSEVSGYDPPKLAGQKAVLHGHCHHKAVLKFPAEQALLRRTGLSLTTLDSGCCGMAGPFGFEKGKFVISQAIGEKVLLPAVRAAAADTLVIADGFSCGEQIAQNTGRRALHTAEALQLGLMRAKTRPFDL